MFVRAQQVRPSVKSIIRLLAFFFSLTIPVASLAGSFEPATTTFGSNVLLAAATAATGATEESTESSTNTPPVPSSVMTEAIDTSKFVPSGFTGWTNKHTPFPGENNYDYIPIADRYRIGFPYWNWYPPPTLGEYPYQRGAWYDPYNQNVLKGDYPIIGEHTFLIVNGLSDSVFDFRRLPLPTNVKQGAFVGGNQTAYVQNFVTGFDLIHGDTIFKPADWELKFTPVFAMHYFDSSKTEAAPPTNHHFTQRDGHVAIQEMFGQAKLADVSSFYDTINVRVGIQGFTSDFRGFVFVDNDPGIRFFGSFDENKWQWNLAYFWMLDKDTFTGLNTIFSSQDVNIATANLTRQDFIFPGYFSQLDFLFVNSNPNHTLDDNGNLVRPANVGTVRDHTVNVGYYGITGDGHIGPINVDHAFYEAYGHDSFNNIAGKSQTVDARMGALELSKDEDWIRYRVSFLYFSGDANPKDHRATGWDAPLDNENFAGDGFSFWGREGVPFPNTGINFKNRFSLIPSFKGSNQPGQAQPNYVNPGLFLYNAAMDLKISPNLIITPNVNFMQVEHTGVIKDILAVNGTHAVSDDLGIDWGVGFKYKPFTIDNVQIAGGAAAFSPFGGWRDIYRGQTLLMCFTAVDFIF